MKRRRKARVINHEPDQSDFSFSVTRVAVSQICRSVGYRAIDSSALNALTLITTKFLQSLAGLAVSYSNSANRTEVNLFDVVNGLQDISLSTSDCFPGGSTIHNTESQCLIKSAVLRNLSNFVTYAPEIPFAKPLPKPEVRGSSGGDLTLSTRSPEVKSVPAWLPPFPDSRLYFKSCTKERSDHLWENSDSVISRETFPPENSNPERSRGRRSGSLPQRRARVRFKLERESSRGGGLYTSDMRFDRRQDNNDGESRCELEVTKKNREEYVYSAGITAGEWPI